MYILLCWLPFTTIHFSLFVLQMSTWLKHNEKISGTNIKAYSAKNLLDLTFFKDFYSELMAAQFCVCNFCQFLKWYGNFFQLYTQRSHTHMNQQER